MGEILVTGSEGSLGRAIVKRLLANGNRVVGVDALLNGQKPSDLGKNYRFIEGDLNNRYVADFAMLEVDSVIQAAARIYGVKGFHDHAADILGEDLSAHNNVLKAAAKHGVKHVTYISSSMVYESHPSTNDGFKEEDALRYVPSTDYGLSKFVGERLSIAFKSQYGIDYTIWRPFNIINPYEQSRGTLGTSHVFADFIKQIVIDKKNPIDIIGSGQQIRCFTWVDDVANVIADFQDDPRVLGESFNLGNKEPMNMIDLANIIYDEAMSLQLLTDAGLPLTFNQTVAPSDDVRFRVPDVSKAEQMLGWKATVDTRESIRRTLENMRSEQEHG